MKKGYMDVLRGVFPEKALLPIHGLAAPYNIPNCYNETLKPGAFDTQVKNWFPIPIEMEHDGAEIGWWLDAKTDHMGLYVFGILAVKDASDPRIVRDMHGMKMSITYLSDVTNDKVTRVNRHKHGFIPKVPSLNKLTTALSAKNKVQALGEVIDSLKASEREEYEPLIVTNALLSEISILPDPAFPHTYVKVGRPDWLKEE